MRLTKKVIQEIDYRFPLNFDACLVLECAGTRHIRFIGHVIREQEYKGHQSIRTGAPVNQSQDGFSLSQVRSDDVDILP